MCFPPRLQAVLEPGLHREAEPSKAALLKGWFFLPLLRPSIPFLSSWCPSLLTGGFQNFLGSQHSLRRKTFNAKPPALCPPPDLDSPLPLRSRGMGSGQSSLAPEAPARSIPVSRRLLSLHYSNHINSDRRVFITVLTTAISHPVMRRLIMSLEQS